MPAQVDGSLTDPVEQMKLMILENVQRAGGLTPVEESRAVQAALDLGMSQVEVAKQTGLGKQWVADRVKISKLGQDTGTRIHDGQISIEDALLIAEFQDDPASVAELELAAGTERFPQKVAEASRRREDRKRAAASRKAAKKQGMRLVEAVVSLDDLYVEGLFTSEKIEATTEAAGDDLTGEALYELLAAEHASCPGHAGTVLREACWVPGLGSVPAGDAGRGMRSARVPASLPPTAAKDAADAADAEAVPPEPVRDPWEDLSAEEFATAKVHRARHLAAVLPCFDVSAEAKTITVKSIVAQAWRGGYGDDLAGCELLEALTGVEGKTKVARALQGGWPLSVLVWVREHWWELNAHHKYMGAGRPGSSYWGESGELRRLLEATGYAWTPVEQQAILLATGKAHDAPTEPTGGDAEGVEGAVAGDRA